MRLVREKAFYRTLFVIALPAAFQSLVSLLVVMLDNIMVSSLGEVALSAVSMSNQITSLFTALILGLASGSSVLISQYWGKQDLGHIKQVFAVVFQICTMVSVLVTALVYFFPVQALSIVTNDAGVIEQAVPYIRIVCFSYLLYGLSSAMVAMLRYMEIVRVTLYISIFSFFCNLGLNYVLIFGKLGAPALGVPGAAVATLITRALELVIVYVYMFHGQRKLTIRPRDLLGRDGLMWKDYARYGLPIAAGDTQWALVGLFKAAIIGRLGVSMIAACNVADSIMSLGMLFTQSLAGGACVVIGKSVGTRDYAKTREYSKTIQLLFACIGVFMALLVFFTRSFTVSWYGGLSAEVQSLAVSLVAVGAFTLMGTCYHASCFVGINRGAGDGKFVFKVDMICGWLVVLPLSYLAAFVFQWPLPVVFLMLRIDQCFKWIIAFFRLRGNRWIRNVTRESEPV